jgi:hypothetical protein
MIMRAWRGFADAAHSQDYPAICSKTVRPKLTELPGFRGLYLLRVLREPRWGIRC